MSRALSGVPTPILVTHIFTVLEIYDNTISAKYTIIPIKLLNLEV